MNKKQPLSRQFDGLNFFDCLHKMYQYNIGGENMKLIIKLNSVTYALKAKEVLRKNGISSKISKNPNPKKGEGCGYILSVNNASKNVLRILETNRVETVDVQWTD